MLLTVYHLVDERYNRKNRAYWEPNDIVSTRGFVKFIHLFEVTADFL
jgi:hypothetical protein